MTVSPFSPSPGGVTPNNWFRSNCAAVANHLWSCGMGHSLVERQLRRRKVLEGVRKKREKATSLGEVPWIGSCGKKWILWLDCVDCGSVRLLKYWWRKSVQWKYHELKNNLWMNDTVLGWEAQMNTDVDATVTVVMKSILWIFCEYLLWIKCWRWLWEQTRVTRERRRDNSRMKEAHKFTW